MRRYTGFISYSQSDKRSAMKIHRWLERYRLPGDVARSLGRKRSLGRFFRDDDEMSASPDISRQINEAIRDSDNLIVICSPRSAKSEWVEAEIQLFRATGRGDRVFAFIIDGDPTTDDPEQACFPPSLRRTGVPAGESLPIEPLGLDLRKDGRERACSRLVAGLLELDFDTLWRRQRRRLARRAALASLAVFALLSLYAGVLLERTRNFNGEKSEFYTQLSRLENEAVGTSMDEDSGQYDRAIRFAMLATRPGLLHPKLDMARDELAKALHAIPNSLQLSPPDADIIYTVLSPGRTELAMLGSDGWLSLIDLERLHVSARFDAGIAKMRAGAYHPTRHWLAFDTADGSVQLIDLDSQKTILTTPKLGQQVSSLRFSDDGQYLLVLGGNAYVVWELATGQAIDRFADPSVRISENTQWIPRSSRLLVAAQSEDSRSARVRVRDPNASEDLAEFGNEEDAVLEIAASRDGKRLFAQIRTGDLTSEDYRIAELSLETFEEVSAIKVRDSLALDFQLDETETHIAVAHGIEDNCFGRFLDIYDLRRQAEPKEIPIAPGACASRVNLDPEGALAITSHQNGVARVWDYRTFFPSEVMKLQSHNGEAVLAAHYLPRQNALVTHGGDGSVMWWDLASYNNFVHAFPFDDQPDGVRFSPSGNRLLAWSKRDVALMEMVHADRHQDQTRAYRRLLDLPFNSSAEVRSAAIVPGRDKVLIFGSTGEIVSTEGPDWELTEITRTDPIRRVEVSGDQTRAAILTANGVSLVELLKDEPPKALDASGLAPRLARFSPDGDNLAVVYGSGTVKTWSLSNGEQSQAIETGALGEFAEMIYAPDHQIALSGDFGFLLADARSGTVHDTSDVNETFFEVGAIARAPDSPWIYLQGRPRDPNFATSRFIARFNTETFQYEDFKWSSTAYDEMRFLGPDRLLIKQGLSQKPLFLMSPTSLEIIASKPDLRFNSHFDFDPASRRAAIGEYGRIMLWDLNWATEESVEKLREGLCAGALSRNALIINERDARKIGLLSGLVGRNVCALSSRNVDAGYALLERGRSPDDLLKWLGEPGTPDLSTGQAARLFLARFSFEDLLEVRGAYRDHARILAASSLASGIGMTRDVDRAAAIYEELANRGHPVALHNLAALKEQESGRTEHTLSLVRQAADRNTWISHRLLGLEAAQENNLAAARSHFERALDQSDGYAGYLMGRIVIDAGSSSEAPSADACKWFEKGARLNDPASLFAMTNCRDYLASDGADPDAAIEAFLKAAVFQDKDASIRQRAEQTYFERARRR